MQDTNDKNTTPILTEEEQKRHKEAIERINNKKEYKKVTLKSILKWFGIRL